MRDKPLAKAALQSAVALFSSYMPQQGSVCSVGHREPRYLTVETPTGMSDQLVAAVSGLALAIMTDRAFILTGRLGQDKVQTGLAVDCIDDTKLSIFCLLGLVTLHLTVTLSHTK